jgi:hypothetical protein
MIWARLAVFISCSMLVFTWRANFRKQKQITQLLVFMPVPLGEDWIDIWLCVKK